MDCQEQKGYVQENNFGKRNGTTNSSYQEKVRVIAQTTQVKKWGKLATTVGILG